jgi:nicotinamidase-related amidase
VTRLDLLDPATGALLVVDLQRSFADPEFLTHLEPVARQGIAAAVERCAELVDRAREQGFPVVWCRLRVRADDPWPASNWFRGMAPDDPWPTEWEPCVEGTPGIEFHGAAPADGELVVDKRTYDAFAGTPLAGELRRRGVDWVAVAGLTTDCCVLATAVSAFTEGFRVVVLSDATAAEDAANHDAALRVLGTHHAVVARAADVPGLGSASRA